MHRSPTILAVSENISHEDPTPWLRRRGFHGFGPALSSPTVSDKHPWHRDTKCRRPEIPTKPQRFSLADRVERSPDPDPEQQRVLQHWLALEHFLANHKQIVCPAQPH